MIIQDNFGKGHVLKNQPINISYDDRVIRGLKAFGFNFFLTVISIFIPVLHFFLVPLFLFLAVYQGYVRFQQTRSLNLNDEICPICSKVLSRGLGYFDDEILRTSCRSCRTKLTVSEPQATKPETNL